MSQFQSPTKSKSNLTNIVTPNRENAFISPKKLKQLTNSPLAKQEEFKDTATKLEKSFQPLMGISKKLLNSVIKNVGINDPKVYQNDNFKESISNFEQSMESYCYGLVNFTINYLFEKDQMSQKDIIELIQNAQKNKTAVYLHKLKSYFGSQDVHSQYELRQMMQGLKLSKNQIKKNLNTYAMEDSDEEGFFGEDQDEDKEPLKEELLSELKLKGVNKNQKQIEQEKIDAMLQNYTRPYKEKMQQVEEQMNDLRKQLEAREETISGLTTGYLKDIQHMKEMMFQKNQNVEEMEFYEVQYFQVSQLLDDNTRKLLNDKLKNLKDQYNAKTKIYVKKILALDAEIDRLKREAQIDKSAQIHNVIKKLQKIEPHPYRLYKAFQDLNIHEQFSKIYLNQRSGFGIDYSSINQLFMSKKFYEKEFTSYKLELDKQFQELVERSVQQINTLNKEIEDKNEEIEKLKQERLDFSEEKEKKILEACDEVIKQKEEILEEGIQAQRQDMLKEFEDLENLKVKLMLKKWSYINQIYKASGISDPQQIKQTIKSLLFDESAKAEMRKSYQGQIRLLKDHNENFQKALIKSQAKCKNLQHEVDHIKMLFDKDQFEEENEQLQKDQLMEELKQSNRKYDKLKNLIVLLFEKMHYRIKEDQFEELDLEDEKKTSSKALINKLAKIDCKQARILREIKDVSLKVNAADQMIDQQNNLQKDKITRDIEIQTKFMDINTKMKNYINTDDEESEEEEKPKDEVVRVEHVHHHHYHTDSKEESQKDSDDESENQEDDDDEEINKLNEDLNDFSKKQDENIDKKDDNENQQQQDNQNPEETQQQEEKPVTTQEDAANDKKDTAKKKSPLKKKPKQVTKKLFKKDRSPSPHGDQHIKTKESKKSKKEQQSSPKGYKSTVLSKMMKEVGDKQTHMKKKLDEREKNLSSIKDISKRQENIINLRSEQYNELTNEIKDQGREIYNLKKKNDETEKKLKEKEGLLQKYMDLVASLEQQKSTDRQKKEHIKEKEDREQLSRISARSQQRTSGKGTRPTKNTGDMKPGVKEIKRMSQDQIKSLTEEQIKEMTSDQIRAMSPEQIRAMTPQQIQAMSQKQQKELSNEQIRSMSYDQQQQIDSETMKSFNNRKHTPIDSKRQTQVKFDSKQIETIDQNCQTDEEDKDDRQKLRSSKIPKRKVDTSHNYTQTEPLKYINGHYVLYNPDAQKQQNKKNKDVYMGYKGDLDSISQQINYSNNQQNRSNVYNNQRYEEEQEQQQQLQPKQNYQQQNSFQEPNYSQLQNQQQQQENIKPQTDKSIRPKISQPNQYADKARKTPAKEQRVFQRLFEDGENRSNRIQHLRDHLQKLEEYHWQEVLSLLHLYSKDDIDPSKLEEQLLFDEQGNQLGGNKLPYINQKSGSGLESRKKDPYEMKLNIEKETNRPVKVLRENNQSPTNQASAKKSRADYYFKKPVNPLDQVQQKLDKSMGEIFQELNQEHFERRKQYLEQLFMNFRNHNERMSNQITQPDPANKRYKMPGTPGNGKRKLSPTVIQDPQAHLQQQQQYHQENYEQRFLVQQQKFQDQMSSNNIIKSDSKGQFDRDLYQQQKTDILPNRRQLRGNTIDGQHMQQPATYRLHQQDIQNKHRRKYSIEQPQEEKIDLGRNLDYHMPKIGGPNVNAQNQANVFIPDSIMGLIKRSKNNSSLVEYKHFINEN